MSRSFIDDLEDLILASTGQPAAAELRARVFAALETSGIPDESYLPTYFVAGMKQLAARQPIDWTDVPDGEIGLSWILRDLVPLLPGAVFREQPGRDEVVVPVLGLALAVETSRTKDRWAVIDTNVAAATQDAATDDIRSFGTFGPTAEQLEQWARDPNLRITLEDEGIAVANERHFELLARLAADPTTVKVPAILIALSELVPSILWSGGAAGLRRIDLVLAQMPGDMSTAPSEARAWVASTQALRDYARGKGPVSLVCARELAQLLLKGRHRPFSDILEANVAPWWQFASTYLGASPREHLYVHPDTGALRWSSIALTADQLAELGSVQLRLTPS
jgi:hypothetical protein